mmetsp:Transcript_149175/g.479120  ORF Transcript_149175/g.479120 Transcript_149175/m.479120 type:complete len:256 (+) Transcript_149175:261-1028(+)
MKVLRLPDRNAHHCRQVVAGRPGANRHAGLAREAHCLLHDGLTACLNPNPRQIRLAKHDPRRKSTLDGIDRCLPPHRGYLPSPLHVLLILDHLREKLQRHGVHRPRHLALLDALKRLHGRGHHGAQANTCARPDLRPRVHDEDVRALAPQDVCNPLALREQRILTPIRPHPRLHRLVHDHVTARCALLLDHLLYLLNWVICPCRIVRIDKASDAGALVVMGNDFVAGCLRRPLVLLVLRALRRPGLPKSLLHGGN